MQPQTCGSPSSSTGLPSSDVATPAPSRSATASTSSTAWRPLPDQDGEALAGGQHLGRRVESASDGSRAEVDADGVTTLPWPFGGSAGISSAWTSCGRITAVGAAGRSRSGSPGRDEHDLLGDDHRGE